MNRVNKKDKNGEIKQIPNDINMGEIYMGTCKTSGKSYIGQAKGYVNCAASF